MNYGILLKCTNNVQHEVDSGTRVKDCARRAGPGRFVIRHEVAAAEPRRAVGRLRATLLQVCEYKLLVHRIIRARSRRGC